KRPRTPVSRAHDTGAAYAAAPNSTSRAVQPATIASPPGPRRIGAHRMNRTPTSLLGGQRHLPARSANRPFARPAAVARAPPYPPGPRRAVDGSRDDRERRAGHGRPDIRRANGLVALTRRPA